MRVLLLAGALALAACGPDASAPVTVDGIDPAQADGDLAPDASLAPGDAGLAPEADVAPEPALAPTDSLAP